MEKVFVMTVKMSDMRLIIAWLKKEEKRKSEIMQKYFDKSCFFIMSSLYLIFFSSFDLTFNENKILIV